MISEYKLLYIEVRLSSAKRLTQIRTIKVKEENRLKSSLAIEINYLYIIYPFIKLLKILRDKAFRLLIGLYPAVL
jgi:hypothetical protein